MRPEFTLAVSCCRLAFSGDGIAEVERQSRGIDWAKFVHLIDKHRIQGLVSRALGAAGIKPPSPHAEIIFSEAREIAQQNLLSARECAHLLDAFSKAGVDLLFVKGLSLSALAYDDPFLKMGIDIDILVNPGDVGQTAEMLASLGYEVVGPSGCSTTAEIRKWHERRKESAWHNPRNGLSIDLHTALVDCPALIPSIGMASPRQSIAITPNWSLPTLATEDMFAYLCVHGTWSAWHRIKWIADVAAILHRQGPGGRQALYEAAVEKGAGRAPSQALLLAHRLFGIQLPDSLRRTIRKDPIGPFLSRLALHEMQKERSPADRRLGTLPLHLMRPILLRGWSAKYSEIKRQLRDMKLHATLPA